MSSSTVADASVPSSSTTLYATASKEWLIPPKPRPGRKPKKDVAPPVEPSDETDAKGRRNQNRAAQRAFRERKQSQLAELQARVQQYEQGDIERNVALQNIAKRLKEENEKLRKENALLKEKLARYDADRGPAKRPRDDCSPQPMYDSVPSPAKKRARASIDPLTTLVHSPYPPASYASSPSALSSADSEAHSSFSPMPSARDAPLFPQAFGLSNIFEMATSGKTSLFEPGGPLDSFDCGFCNENTPCVCRELALQQVAERMSNQSAMKLELSDHPNSTSLTASPIAAAPQPSILDNLPAYQPPIPLRRRAPNPSFQPIFPITLPTAAPPEPEIPGCTGDPSNCPACADDAFGKAFCDAISKSVAESSPCKDCPCASEMGGGSCSKATGGACCGNPAGCAHTGGDLAFHAAVGPAAQLTSSLLMSEPLSTPETVSCDAAWRQIKSHPNAAFTDLALLADVVARRSKCTGPRVEISPAPGAITPERGLGSPYAAQQQQQLQLQLQHQHQLDSQPILLTDPHAHYHERQRSRGHSGSASPPRLVPRDVLVKCGRQRVREVMADGVRDALRLLDASYGTPL
ncbi:uncharacterized protein BXZ73DRAFT_73716 [Epithele typhae]|uniref:uncharacterized protein n=1 Tax=Epithele typhae TaxID=378194 RepID=UPI002008D465|nr:uncharacterized protein BXZ73DRAFT_73716 [Epithele typhae]KAH9944107.1 hypothetical protein BXZ73DRAFT_73716 [Epithele typhae]